MEYQLSWCSFAIQWWEGNLVMLFVLCVDSIIFFIVNRELWGSRSIGEHTERQLESMKSKKKVNDQREIFIICA